MLKSLKATIKQVKEQQCDSTYEAKVYSQKNVYFQWILQNEGKNAFTHIFRNVIPRGIINLEDGYLLWVIEDGFFVENVKERILEYLKKNPKIQLFYSDEDELAGGERINPNFKPDWSPDTLFSFPYFGSFFVLSEKLYKLVDKGAYNNEPDMSYDFLLKAALTLQTDEVGHLPEVLFHKTTKAVEITEELMEHYERIREKAKVEKPGTDSKVSIIIPSKDHPQILERCLDSITSHTDYKNYEIIVVDNGSNEENRMQVSLLQTKYTIRYIYEKMDFNFSAMCNLGVSKAGGELVLLLNDDIEICQDDWIGRMAAKAMEPEIGAVGAKLLFPDSDLIQHTGVNILRVGPAHKLLQASDSISHYYGRNRFNYNVPAVTGACLMVRKEVFEQVQGLPEDLRVGYNDVDFCVSLLEKGYRNVVLNSVKLYHHESLSRGDDRMTKEKYERLLTEKEVFYKKHPWIRNADPYYSKNLTENKPTYEPNVTYPFEDRGCVCPVKKYKAKIEKTWYNECLKITVERARTQEKENLEDKEDIFHIEGWSYVLHNDNSHYKRFLILTGTDGVRYRVPVIDRYREDVEEILPEEIKISMAGFVVRIKKEKLPVGTYKIGLMACDLTSRQILYQDTCQIVENKDE